MGSLSSFINLIFGFILTNFYKIVVGIVLTAISAGAFYVTLLSIKKLKIEVFPYYPFDKFFPQSGSWSVLYFLIIILLLGALIFFISRGGFYLAPA